MARFQRAGSPQIRGGPGALATSQDGDRMEALLGGSRSLARTPGPASSSLHGSGGSPGRVPADKAALFVQEEPKDRKEPLSVPLSLPHSDPF